MLKPLAPGQLWIAEMPFHLLGLDLGARMTVVRLADGSLFLHSPIRLDAELKSALDALGPVGFVIAPNSYHRLHVAEFARAHPDAKLYGPPDFKKKPAGVQFTGILGDMPEPAWAADLDQTLFLGNKLTTEVDFFHRATRTLILTDVCFNISPDRSLSTRVFGSLSGIIGRLTPSRAFRLFTRDRSAARASVERVLAWNFDRIILSHGDIIETGGREAFRQAFAWLLD